MQKKRRTLDGCRPMIISECGRPSARRGSDDRDDTTEVVVPLQLRTGSGPTLSFLSTVTTFGTALDLTATELSIEAFLPADEATAAALG